MGIPVKENGIKGKGRQTVVSMYPGHIKNKYLLLEV